MKILAFDTSGNQASVALSTGGRVIAYSEETRPERQAERLIPMIGEILGAAGLEYGSIDYCAATRGPGSFTGIRIGLAAAKALSMATRVKFLGIDVFSLHAFRAKPQAKKYRKIYVCLNAYRGELYLRVYVDGAPKEPALLTIPGALDILRAEKESSLICGNGLEFIYREIKESANFTILPRFPVIKAIHICRYVDSLDSLENLPLEPLYIKPPDAKLPKIS